MQWLLFRGALARNAIKIALPWTLGQAAVYAIVASSTTGYVPPSIWMLTGAAHVLTVVYLTSLFIGTGRTPMGCPNRT